MRACLDTMESHENIDSHENDDVIWTKRKEKLKHAIFGTLRELTSHSSLPWPLIFLAWVFDCT